MYYQKQLNTNSFKKQAHAFVSHVFSLYVVDTRRTPSKQTRLVHAFPASASASLYAQAQAEHVLLGEIFEALIGKIRTAPPGDIWGRRACALAEANVTCYAYPLDTAGDCGPMVAKLGVVWPESPPRPVGRQDARCVGRDEAIAVATKDVAPALHIDQRLGIVDVPPRQANFVDDQGLARRELDIADAVDLVDEMESFCWGRRVG